MPLTAQEQQDRQYWYSAREVNQLLDASLKGNKHVNWLPCQTSLGRLKALIKQHPEGNLAIPFLLEGEGGRNHFYTIFRQTTADGAKFIVQDSNGAPAPDRLTHVLKLATPGATVESWNVPQQDNNRDCGPHVVNNLVDMAKAVSAAPDKPLTPDVLSIKTPQDMTDIRWKHAQVLDKSAKRGDFMGQHRAGVQNGQPQEETLPGVVGNAIEAVDRTARYVFDTTPGAPGLPPRQTPFFGLIFMIFSMLLSPFIKGKGKGAETSALAELSSQGLEHKKSHNAEERQRRQELAEASAEGGCRAGSGIVAEEQKAQQPEEKKQVSDVDISGVKIPSGVAIVDAQRTGKFVQRYNNTQTQQKGQHASPAA